MTEGRTLIETSYPGSSNNFLRQTEEVWSSSFRISFHTRGVSCMKPLRFVLQRSNHHKAWSVPHNLHYSSFYLELTPASGALKCRFAMRGAVPHKPLVQ